MNATLSLTSFNYSIDNIKDETKALVENGSISRRQPIYCLAKYIPAREWLTFVRALELGDFLMRDRIVDLIGSENWDND